MRRPLKPRRISLATRRRLRRRGRGERGNRYLDRATLVPTLADRDSGRDVAYFRSA